MPPLWLWGIGAWVRKRCFSANLVETARKVLVQVFLVPATLFSTAAMVAWTVEADHFI